MGGWFDKKKKIELINRISRIPFGHTINGIARSNGHKKNIPYPVRQLRFFPMLHSVFRADGNRFPFGCCSAVRSPVASH
jgi:hypothetical protein